ncbi:AraC family transcriptional regulator [Paeniglutamicibacter cryotolerans]|uniref:AraC-like DNA-binding protein n=1 Tax=Paeniglutamicibacter cryotolerans TaxID=670079 RepID=A0A839QME2_9MICC|nr:AraC family transcriptional regulator [Paeniglutamicibacter cryotolerans]MBB2995775.1 AraC-like DNA-binding protein [Paeniglutamicibacter cryotolerans]
MTVETPMVTTFSTDRVPAGQRVSYWERHSEASLMSLTCSVDDKQDFLARQFQLPLSRLRYLRMHGSGHSIGRIAAGIRDLPADVLFLCLLTGGEAAFGQGSGTDLLGRGEGILYDPDVPFTYSFARELNQVVVELPRDLFHSITGQEGLLRSRLIRRDGSPGVDGMGWLIALVQRSIDQPETARAQEDTALALLVDMLLQIPRSPAEDHVAAASRFIAENVSNPGLSVPRIARGLGITPRHLNRVFAAQGRSVAAHVLEVRLERAHGLLLDPRHAQLNISRIAALAGFSSAAHFARTFRARYGHSATEVRRGTPR